MVKRKDCFKKPSVDVKIRNLKYKESTQFFIFKRKEDKKIDENNLNADFDFDRAKIFSKINRFSVHKVLNKMKSAVDINEHLKRESGSAELIIINLPTPPKIVDIESVTKCKILVLLFI